MKFADGSALISENEEDLQNLLNNTAIACKEYDMALNVKKTKVMVISRGKRKETAVNVDGEILEQEEKYKYLGSWIRESGNCDEGVKIRIKKAKKDFW